MPDYRLALPRPMLSLARDGRTVNVIAAAGDDESGLLFLCIDNEGVPLLAMSQDVRCIDPYYRPVSNLQITAILKQLALSREHAA